MGEYGILVEYDFCCGCFTCEIACKQELGLPAGQSGIRVRKVGPEIMNGKLNVYWFPLPTDTCNLCEHRIKEGGIPSCVKHCVTACLKFGKLEDLVQYMKQRPRTMLFTPK